MKLIGLALLFTVVCASAQFLDTHNDPFALPPYSWTEFDIKSYEVKKTTNDINVHYKC